MVSIFGTCGLALAAPHPATAQNELDFFEPNTALTVFDNGVTKSDLPRLKMLREIEDKKPELAKQSEIIDGNKPEETELLDAKVEKSTEDNSPQASQAPLTSKLILEKYGDPTKDVPVKAQSNAPAPFAAMLEAVNTGDDKLAFQYARQYVRYMRDLKQTTRHAYALQVLAMEQEGLRPKGGANTNDPFMSERSLVGDQLKDTPLTESSNSSSPMKLDPRVKDFLKMAAEKEGVKSSELGIEPPDTNTTKVKEDPKIVAERTNLRNYFVKRAPIDPKGEVDLYLFVRTNDPQSKTSAKLLQEFANKNVRDQKIRIVALTIENEDVGAIDIFRQNTGVGYPVVNSGQFAKKAGISKAPTLVALAKNSGASMSSSGNFSLIFLEELTKYMQGGNNGSK